MLHFSVGRGESCYISQWGGENLLAAFLSGEGRILLHFSVWRGKSCYMSQWGGENRLATFLMGGRELHFLGEERNIHLLHFSFEGIHFWGGERALLSTPFTNWEDVLMKQF